MVIDAKEINIDERHNGTIVQPPRRQVLAKEQVEPSWQSLSKQQSLWKWTGGEWLISIVAEGLTNQVASEP